jgi:chromosome segregation and condensation protein ScpB
MPNVVHKVDALVRKRPGITKGELRNALGTDVDRALIRLVRVGYVKQVRTDRGRAYYYPIEGPRDGDTQAN